MEDVFLMSVQDRCIRKNDVSYLWQPLHRGEDDRVSVALDKRAHADAGRRETHFLSFRQQSCQLRDQYVILYSHPVYFIEL